MTAGLTAGRESTSAGAATYRPDVEGLRAVAVGLVLVYHAGVGLLPGGFVGVDVFFVISGFLITGLLLREVEATGRVSLLRFYGRRAKRLLPAAGTVLAVSAALTAAVLPVVDWRVLAGDVGAAALYVVNWRLADRSVDYLAEDTGPSVVQHFWSLAVEEQFYVLWPLLILLAAWWVRRSGWSLRPTMGLALAAVGVPSLAWSVYLTGQDPARAFFVTTTRLWELALGAAVALAVPLLPRLPARAARLLGWAGLLAVLVAAVAVSAGSPWPGSLALLPTLGTAAVIAAGPAAGGRGPVRLLGRPAMVWVGGLSYSLYLWHWPLVVAATAWAGGLTAGLGVAVVAASVLPAWLTHRYLENPLRHSPTLSRLPGRALAVGAGFTGLGLAAGVALLVAVPSAGAPAPQQARGAQALATPPVEGTAPSAAPETDSVAGAPVKQVDGITPDPLLATEDLPVEEGDDCQVEQADVEPLSCTYGDEDAERVIALAGDSKALQWLPALDAIGERRGWRVETWTKSACPFTAAEVSVDGEAYRTCSRWNELVAARLQADAPEVLLTSTVLSTARVDGEQSRGAMVAGLREQWRPLQQQGTQVAVLQDNQSPGFQVYECVAENLDDLTRCTFPKDVGASQQTLAEAAEGVPGVAVVDLNDAICPTPQCAPVIGNVLVYRQGSHLTATYVESLTDRLDAELAPVLRRAQR